MTPGGRKPRIEGDVAYIPLTKGYETVIDASDLPIVAAWQWGAQVTRRADGTIRAVYAVRNTTTANNKRIHIKMHRCIIAAPPGSEVDHRDGDGLNNRRCNLRFATRPQNQFNSRIPRNNTSGFKGVSFHKKSGKWAANIGVEGKKLHLGLFAAAEEAANAYRQAMKRHHGEFGREQ